MRHILRAPRSGVEILRLLHSLPFHHASAPMLIQSLAGAGTRRRYFSLLQLQSANRRRQPVGKLLIF
jgi:hypothetical protein